MFCYETLTSQSVKIRKPVGFFVLVNFCGFSLIIFIYMLTYKICSSVIIKDSHLIMCLLRELISLIYKKCICKPNYFARDLSYFTIYKGIDEIYVL